MAIYVFFHRVWSTAAGIYNDFSITWKMSLWLMEAPSLGSGPKRSLANNELNGPWLPVQSPEQGVREEQTIVLKQIVLHTLSDQAPWAQLGTAIPGLLLAGISTVSLGQPYLPATFQGLTLQPVMQACPQSDSQPCPPSIYWCPPLHTEGGFFQLKPSPSSLNPQSPSICPL